MNGWLVLWTAVLAAALLMFAALVVVVTIGGFVDIRVMLAGLQRQHDEEKISDARRRSATASRLNTIAEKAADSAKACDQVRSL